MLSKIIDKMKENNIDYIKRDNNIVFYRQEDYVDIAYDSEYITYAFDNNKSDNKRFNMLVDVIEELNKNNMTLKEYVTSKYKDYQTSFEGTTCFTRLENDDDYVYDTRYITSFRNKDDKLIIINAIEVDKDKIEYTITLVNNKLTSVSFSEDFELLNNIEYVLKELDIKI